MGSFDQLSNYHSSAEPPKKLISIDTFGGNISNKCRHDFDHNKAWWPDFNLDFLEGDSRSAVSTIASLDGRGDITGAASHCGVKIINDVRSGANSNPANQTAAVERGWGNTNFNCDDSTDL